MKKNVVTIPMTINLRCFLVFVKPLTRLASMTGSLIFIVEMTIVFKIPIIVTAPNAMAMENNISREVTRILESQVVMPNTWVTVITHQPKSFSPTKIVASLM